MRKHEDDEDESPGEVLDGLSYVNRPQKVEPFVIAPLVSPGAFMNIYGHSKAGKSLLALGLAIDVSSPDGPDLWMEKYPIERRGPALWLEADNSATEWQNVVRLVHNEGFDISNIHFADQNMMPYPFDLLNPERREIMWLADQYKRIQDRWGYDAVISFFDTVREIHSGDEDKSNVMRNVLTAMQEARHIANSESANTLISHSRKGGGVDQGHRGNNKMSQEDAEGDVVSENRGSSAFAARMQGIIRVTTNRQRTHGFFTAGGRNIGYHRFRMKQTAPTYLWSVDVDPGVELVKELRETNPEWGVRQIAREVAQTLKWTDERARSLTRRVLESVES